MKSFVRIDTKNRTVDGQGIKDRHGSISTCPEIELTYANLGILLVSILLWMGI